MRADFSAYRNRRCECLERLGLFFCLRFDFFFCLRLAALLVDLLVDFLRPPEARRSRASIAAIRCLRRSATVSYPVSSSSFLAALRPRRDDLTVLTASARGVGVPSLLPLTEDKEPEEV